MRGIRAAAIGGLCALGIGAGPVLLEAAPATDAGGALIAAYNGCGQQLFAAFAKKPGNVALSPYSIGAAMAMALAGARGETEAEMAKVLRLGLRPEEVNASNQAVLASLGKASASFQLLVANALMLTKKGSLMISAGYVSTLRQEYAAEVFRGADLATVNGWVKQKTNGKIGSIINRLDPSTALVLLDAIYFKAAWQAAFDAKATRDETFHLLKGEAKVPTMHIRGDFVTASRPGYRAIRLPYMGARVDMIVILPAADTADAAQRLDGDEMRILLTALHAPVQPVDLSLPRFKADFKASLVEPFTEMGMRRAFNARTADFSGMTGKPRSEFPLAIAEIVHRAVIDVTEQGTEAAAATGVTVVATGARRPQSVETFRVDRPFLFAIIDEETGAVLFEGRIVDPR